MKNPLNSVRWMHNFLFPTHREVTTAWGCIAILAMISWIHFAPDSLRQNLQFDRRAVLDGEWYRLATCHFVHLSFEHFAHVVWPFLVVGLVYESGGGLARMLRIVNVLALSALSITAALWWGHPEIGRYTGLSGPSYALAALVFFDWYRATGRKIFLLFFPVYVGRILAGHEWYHDAEFTTAWWAHGVGLATGVAWLALEAWLRHKGHWRLLHLLGDTTIVEKQTAPDQSTLS
ncbi:MAG: rhomboid family intramembrane serine protease [Magnetococcales bacterium]|nr:rhomboid family intramembrane serine protease [Magnetococcales bacterium]